MDNTSFPRERYAGKPFLKLVDSWLLKSIGFLGDEQESLLQAMTPKLQQVYGHTGTWDQIVRDQLAFPEGAEKQIRSLWEQSVKTASEAGQAASPLVFVELFVKANIEA